MKLLSISIAAYNAESTLEKCINSMIKSNHRKELEILIVNDGSTDNTVKIAKNYENKYPDTVKVIDKENGGHGSTINVGVSVATGLYFKTVDADDWVETENLDTLIEKLTGVADLVVNPYYEVNAKTGQKRKKEVCDLTVNYEQVYDFKDCVSNIKIAMHSMTIKTSILKNMNIKIDEKCFYVDMEYTLFPLPMIEKVVFLKDPVYDYLLGTSTQSMNLNVFISRRKQHERVLLRLFDYYNELDNKEDSRSEAIKNRIVAATYIQYRIILMLPIKDSFVEMVAFDKTVPDEIFADISGRTKTLLKFFRKTNYKGYRFSVSILKMLKVIKMDEKVL